MALDIDKKQHNAFADLILPLPIPKLLTYGVPPAASPMLGSRVIVPLGTRKIVTGVVAHMHNHPPNYPTKDILEILDTTPILSATQLAFFTWMADYYLCTLGEVLKAALPAGLRLSSQSRLQLSPTADLTRIVCSDAEQQVIELLQKHASLSYTALAKAIDRKHIPGVMKRLLAQKVVLLFEEVQEKYKPKKELRIRLAPPFVADMSQRQGLFHQLERSPKQLDILLKYISLTAQAPTLAVPKKELLGTTGSTAALRSLLKQGVFLEEEVIVPRISPVQTTPLPTDTLSAAQQTALDALYQAFKTHDTVLLHGVTGSGKTALYVRLIQDTLKQGGQVIYLLPEIGLATQMVSRLTKVLGHQLAVYHAKYASNERVEIWHSLLAGTCSLVVGVRAALLLPFHNLQLIIVDEEHAPSYKQTDTAPRYHARDAALMLAKHHKARVLLGSATPSLEVYYYAQIGKYGLVKLTERFGKAALPVVHLANLAAEHHKKPLYGEFTTRLLEAMRAALSRQEQVIVFQNRRGYAAYVLCIDCHWVPRCTQCAISLTYHQSARRLVCHYCGYRMCVPPECPVCGARRLKNVGFGTEKLEETLQQCFPDKYVKRMDADTTRHKQGYAQLLTALEQGHVDMLVGTQMITKGLDFARVALVGVLDIDRLLYFPDFRAHERCFQLVTQVGGRAGRREKQGQVIIQTQHPQHPVLDAIVHHDYEQMYRRELTERATFWYPPYVRLIKVTLQHVDQAVVTAGAQELAHQLRSRWEERVLGPQAPCVARVKSRYRMDIWVKIPKQATSDRVGAKKWLQEVTYRLLRQQAYRQLSVIFDVDPA
ncbi:MAG: primosomal protein N' [Bacteroidota bacterium]